MAHLGCLKMVKEAALSGLGFAIIPQQTCLADIQQGKLIVLTFDKEPEDLVLYTYSGRLKHSARKIKALLDHLYFEAQQP
tara:strand:- start:61 stop:300 length:240 start_codon:yes stop_codon:yes gene_type:complete